MDESKENRSHVSMNHAGAPATQADMSYQFSQSRESLLSIKLNSISWWYWQIEQLCLSDLHSVIFSSSEAWEIRNITSLQSPSGPTLAGPLNPIR